ncbi:hypothetical protein BKA81DRAFT_347530 [Phyllosticta paracitricarpa]
MKRPASGIPQPVVILEVRWRPGSMRCDVQRRRRSAQDALSLTTTHLTEITYRTCLRASKAARRQRRRVSVDVCKQRHGQGALAKAHRPCPG